MYYQSQLYVGEIFEEPAVVGCMLAARGRFDVISVWNAHPQSTRFEIGEKLKGILQVCFPRNYTFGIFFKVSFLNPPIRFCIVFIDMHNVNASPPPVAHIIVCELRYVDGTRTIFPSYVL